MGLKHQRNKGRMEISVVIRDEQMRRIYDSKEMPLEQGLGNLLSFLMNKLDFGFMDIIRAELRSESDYFKQKKEQELVESVKKLVGDSNKKQK